MSMSNEERTSMSDLQQPVLPKFMMAARLHAIGEPMRVDQIPVPEPRPTDVLVEVKACGIVPNLQRVIDNFFGTQTADRKLFPPLPAIFGLDPAGVIAKVGSHVTSIRMGERVYVNPARGCGSCRMCRAGQMLNCAKFSFQGYFARSREIMAAYPYGGFSQYITAPVNALVKLPARVGFYEAARLGYLGTAYSAMKKIGVGPGNVLLINGISGTLGLCAALLGLAMGASRILGTGRNVALLERVRSLAPERIFVYAMTDEKAAQPGDGGDDPFIAWTTAMTDGACVDGFIDCLPPGAPARTMMRAIHALRRGGKAVNVGAVTDNLPLNAFWMMTNQISVQGSVWFTAAEGEEIVGLADAGLLDLSVFQHRVAPLSGVNDTLAEMRGNRQGGFANYIIEPSPAA
jgi:D-arabinose 1-dehydrogenase-like Zn-dependent alcohol dehydrogenase